MKNLLIESVPSHLSNSATDPSTTQQPVDASAHGPQGWTSPAGLAMAQRACEYARPSLANVFTKYSKSYW